MPQPVIDALWGLLLGPPIAMHSAFDQAKLFPDGTYQEQARGWWAGGDRYVAIKARRLLAPAEGQQLLPVTGWGIDGSISYFQPGVAPVYSQWRIDPDASPQAKKLRSTESEDVLGQLPEELTRPLHGAKEATSRVSENRGWAHQTIVCAFAGPNFVRVLKAQREGTSLRALDSAEWHVVTLNALFGSVQGFGTDARGQITLGPLTQPPPGPAQSWPVVPPT